MCRELLRSMCMKNFLSRIRRSLEEPAIVHAELSSVPAFHNILEDHLPKNDWDLTCSCLTTFPEFTSHNF